ncbi:MAG: FKBP-type peptidyl-prolyl cis-trans isomerase [Myxococcota bacterium]
MEHVSEHDKVLIHFTGRLLDGRVVDTSEGKEAVELQLGDGTVLPGLEKALVGMQPGETKTALLRAEDAFGERRRELVLRIDANQLPPEVNPQVGEVLTMQNEKGAQLKVHVADVNPNEIILDANHPLAGQDVTFDIELVGIVGDAGLS